MTKDDLLAELETILSNFTYGIALRCYFPEAQWLQVIDKPLEFEFGKEKALIEIRPIVNRLSDAKEKNLLIEEYEKSLKRSLLSEGHEVILKYCEETNQFPKYKNEPWFQFARIIRNIVSHKEGGVLRQWPADLTNNGTTSVTWRTRTIGNSMVGKTIDFYPGEALRLFQDQKDFVEKRML